jgi:hypothetical protein
MDASTTPLLPRMVLGFPRYAQGQGSRASPNALQEGRVTPADITVSVDFSRPSQPRLGRSIMLHHTRRPPPRAITALQAPPPSHHDQQSGVSTDGKGQPGAGGTTSATTSEGTTRTATCRHRLDASTGVSHTHLVRTSPSGLVKFRSLRCSVRAADLAAPNSNRTSVRQEEHHRVGSRPART